VCISERPGLGTGQPRPAGGLIAGAAGSAMAMLLRAIVTNTPEWMDSFTICETLK
jgi:hypothetical protein